VICPLARRAALAALLAVLVVPAWASDRFIDYLYVDANEGGGVGEGLGDAAVREAELETYKTSLSRSDPLKMQAIQLGYDTRQ